MQDNINNLVLEHLRAIRDGQDRIEHEVKGIKSRLTSLESSTAAGRHLSPASQFGPTC